MKNGKAGKDQPLSCKREFHPVLHDPSQPSHDAALGDQGKADRFFGSPTVAQSARGETEMILGGQKVVYRSEDLADFGANPLDSGNRNQQDKR